jgi:hypothetical protein
VVGPFPAAAADDDEDQLRSTTPEERLQVGSYGLSTSHPSSTELARVAARNAISASTVKGQWHAGEIKSIRNLRLPVTTLEPGQVGTLSVVLDVDSEDGNDHITGGSDSEFHRRFRETTHTTAASRIRKGMVVAVPTKHMLDSGLSLQAASGLTAYIDDPDALTLALGTPVIVYVASVRASARVLRVTLGKRHGPDENPSNTATEDIEDIFGLVEGVDTSRPLDEDNSGSKMAGVEVSLELLTNREWIELGSKVIVLESASKDKSGLEGFVGKVVEIFD